MQQSSARDGGRPRAPLTAAVPAQRRRSERRPDPVLSEAYAHLSLDALRAYRSALSDEERRVSYWRRILQARLDLVASGTTRRDLDHARLAPLLTSARVGAGRRTLSTVVHGDGTIPPLPRLEELWERQVAPDDEVGRGAFEDDLRAAEQQLSAYRTALHERIGSATVELIARYRESPGLCLVALPLAPPALDRTPRH
jgi:hypothetical protein